LLLSDLSSGGIDLAYVEAAYGGLHDSDIRQFASSPAFRVWTGPITLAASNDAVGTTKVGGVFLDRTGILRYYLLTKA
jgi:hypothetical protein